MYKIKVTYSEKLMLNGKVEDKNEGSNEYYSKEYPKDLEDVVIGTLNNLGVDGVLSFDIIDETNTAILEVECIEHIEGKVVVVSIRQEDIEITEIPKKRV